MKILLVNDDGYQAQGIHSLIKALKEEHELVVAAPSTHRSGSSHCISEGVTVTAREVYLEDVEHPVWAVDGTPADCTLWALNELMGLDHLPDLVLSGINMGYNLSEIVNYSGTVAAAHEGFIMGIPSVALSTSSRHRNYDDAATVVRAMLPRLLESKRPFFYNVNIPALPPEEIKGIMKAPLCPPPSVQARRSRTNPFSDFYWWEPDSENSAFDLVEGSDMWAVKEGYVAITPIKLNYMNFNAMKHMPDFSDLELSSRNSVDAGDHNDNNRLEKRIS